MRKTTKADPAPLPKRFGDLVALMAPRAISDDVAYENTLEMIDRLMASGRLTKGQSDFLETLVQLLEAYESRHHAIDVADLSGLATLRHLMKQRGMNGSDLARLLGLHTTSYAYTCAAAFLSGASYVPREGLSLLGVTRTAELAALLRSPHTWAKSEAMLANVHAFAEGWASQLEHRAHMGSMVHIGLTDGCKWSHPHKNAGDFRPVHQVHMYMAYRDCMRSLIDALQPQKSCVIVDVAGSIPIAQVCTASRVPQVSRSE